MSYLRWVFLLVAALAAGAVAIETFAPSKSGGLSSLSVELNAYVPKTVSLDEWRRHRGEHNDGHVFTAPCDVHILASIGATGNLRAGDAVLVEFLADTNRIGSQTCVWHDEVNPSKQRHGRGAVPMFISSAGFSAAEIIWHNPSPGQYALSAKASYGQTVSANSAQLSIIVVSAPTAEN